MNMYTSPMVSIVMTTHNRASFISDAISSIFSQTFKDWELLIIDDGSTDNTTEVVSTFLSDPRVSYSKNESNRGIVCSRNKALELSKGKYISVLDSDDVWNDSEKLKVQVSFLEDNFKHVLVGCGTISIIDENGKQIVNIEHPVSDQEIRKHMLYKNPFTHSSILFRKNIIDKIGGYHTYAVGEDYDLCLRLGLEGKMENIKGIPISYRKHQSNISVQKRFEALKLNIGIIKKYKHRYPHFLQASIRRYTRFAGGWMLNLFFKI